MPSRPPVGSVAVLTLYRRGVRASRDEDEGSTSVRWFCFRSRTSPLGNIRSPRSSTFRTRRPSHFTARSAGLHTGIPKPCRHGSSRFYPTMHGSIVHASYLPTNRPICVQSVLAAVVARHTFDLHDFSGSSSSDSSGASSSESEWSITPLFEPDARWT